MSLTHNNNNNIHAVYLCWEYYKWLKKFNHNGWTDGKTSDELKFLVFPDDTFGALGMFCIK